MDAPGILGHESECPNGHPAPDVIEHGCACGGRITYVPLAVALHLVEEISFLREKLKESGPETD